MLICQIVHWSGETGQGAGSHSLSCHLSVSYRAVIPTLNMGLDYFMAALFIFVCLLASSLKGIFPWY